MKVKINNLTALMHGRDLTIYQRSLAIQEWHKLLNHVEEMEQALKNENHKYDYPNHVYTQEFKDKLEPISSIEK
jgi:hypothetical protein